MIGIPYIAEVFTNILQESKVMQGRFGLCPKWGQEVNTPNLEDVLKTAIMPGGIKYPCAVLMPPRISPVGGSWDMLATMTRERYSLTILFVTGTYTTGTGMPKSPGPDGKSQHSIAMDWHDMQRCARDFVKVLRMLMIDRGLQQYMKLGDEPPLIEMVSTAGNDQVSGVQMDFQLYLFSGCDIEDYDIGALQGIDIPSADSHPSHLH